MGIIAQLCLTGECNEYIEECEVLRYCSNGDQISTIDRKTGKGSSPLGFIIPLLARGMSVE